MGDFIGTNAFIATPMNVLKPVGWIREYHPISFNEEQNDIFEYNRWSGYWDFDKFYEDLKENNVMVCPVLWSSPSWLQPNGDHRPVVDDEDPLIPNSYREISEFIYQFVGRYGHGNVDENNLMVNTGQVKKSNLGLIEYFEDWNEQDKDWAGEASEFSASQYAAMASANVDGHCGTMGPLYGMKQADPNAKFVMGGLTTYDTKYLNNMKSWFVKNRADSAWPIDVINFHHYAMIRDVAGVSPEDNYFKQRIAAVIKWKDLNAPESEVWLTEFGYDSNPISMNQAPEIGSFSQDQVQAIWNLRTFLIASSTGIERAAHFMIRDTGGADRFGSSGLTTSPDDGYKPKVSWYYLHTMRSLLEKMYFSEVITENDSIWIYKFETASKDTAVYACWRPTSDASTMKYNFKTTITCDTIRTIKLMDKSVSGESTIYTYNNEGVNLTISEAPLFIEVIKDTSSVASRTLPNSSATWTIATISMGNYVSNATFAYDTDTVINFITYHTIRQSND
ncbi:MAG: hypothetical protein PF450_07255, partial [Bacteroidales bacterium]|nr:hypothetical protein [Bacteroidales bacterium]